MIGKLTPVAALAGFALVALGLAGFAPRALGADYTVYSPNVVRGENELEARGHSSWGTGEEGSVQELRLAFARGLTGFWATELYLTSEQEAGGGLEVHEVEWENRFQLTPQGKYWLTAGLLTEIEYERGGQYEVKFGPILSKDFGRFTTLLNVLFAHEYGNDAESGVELSYRARLEYRWQPAFSPLIEAYGEPVGRTGAWGEPHNQIGPGFTGELGLGAGESLHYGAVVLFGLSAAAPDTTLVLRMEYEFF